MISLENIESRFNSIIDSSEWRELESKFKTADEVYICCHGGNLAIARHISTDLTRLTKNKKKVTTPDVDTVAVWHGDFNYESWLVQWLDLNIKRRYNDNILVLGISSSGASPDVDNALLWANDRKIDTALISGLAVDLPVTNINLDIVHYYMGEALTLLLAYELLRSAGYDIPQLKTIKNANTDIRENSFADELKNIGVDFDGVIHKCSKGYYDGTIYDEPIEGSSEALEELSKKYDVIIYTAKAKPDRGLINGKTGTQLVWEWLKEHKMDKFVTKVTAEKPRAVAYIDDKSVAFNTWNDCLATLKEQKIL